MEYIHFSPDEVESVLHVDAMLNSGYQPTELVRRDALEGALARPIWLDNYMNADAISIGIAYIEAISEAQAFLDGNKRTAMHTGLTFLEINGWQFAGDSELLAVSIEECAGEKFKGGHSAELEELLRCNTFSFDEAMDLI